MVDLTDIIKISNHTKMKLFSTLLVGVIAEFEYVPAVEKADETCV